MKKIFAILLSLLTLLSCGLLSACSAEKTQPDTLDTETVWETVSEVEPTYWREILKQII